MSRRRARPKVPFPVPSSPLKTRATPGFHEVAKPSGRSNGECTGRASSFLPAKTSMYQIQKPRPISLLFFYAKSHPKIKARGWSSVGWIKPKPIGACPSSRMFEPYGGRRNVLVIRCPPVSDEEPTHNDCHIIAGRRPRSCLPRSAFSSQHYRRYGRRTLSHPPLPRRNVR